MYKEMVYMRRQKSQYQRCARCENIFSSAMMDPHHPYRRQRKLTAEEIQKGPTKREMILNPNLLYDSMMEFVLICRLCHDFIHEHEDKAKQEGWIL
jgi:hypothetical protein